MPTRLKLAVIASAFWGVSQSSHFSAAAQESTPNLVGVYRLTVADLAEPRPTVGYMRIVAQNGREFLIGVRNRSTNPSENWRGHGVLNGEKGFYVWRFSDGRSGRTDFNLEPDGSLRGHVLGEEVDWHFRAEKQRAEVRKTPRLVGRYTLFQVRNPEVIVGDLQILAQHDSGFEIRIGQQSESEQFEWTGMGILEGREGLYEWELPDGKTGKTTFVVDEEGSIHGCVRGGGVDWDYVARPVKDPVVKAP